MIRRGKTLLQYLVDGWTLIHDEEGWHIEKDLSELHVSEFAIWYLNNRNLIKVESTRTAYSLDRTKLV